MISISKRIYIMLNNYGDDSSLLLEGDGNVHIKCK